jgi:hypothetical protein
MVTPLQVEVGALVGGYEHGRAQVHAPAQPLSLAAGCLPDFMEASTARGLKCVVSVGPA